MKTNSKLTDVSTSEMRDAVGGINFATIQFLRTTSNLNQMQVSALKYYNRLEDPAKYQGIMPDMGGSLLQGTTQPVA